MSPSRRAPRLRSRRKERSQRVPRGAPGESSSLDGKVAKSEEGSSRGDDIGRQRIMSTYFRRRMRVRNRPLGLDPTMVLTKPDPYAPGSGAAFANPMAPSPMRSPRGEEHAERSREAHDGTRARGRP